MLAEERHVGQYRPNRAREPKINHIGEVASLVASSGGTEDEIVAAWLHDIVEDTDTTFEEIGVFFGDEIADLVDGLTDPPEFSSMPLHIRKENQAIRLKQKSLKVKRIKLCDQISNVRSVVNDPPLDWSQEKCLAYIEGAKKLADICLGICSNLDSDFNSLYCAGLMKYDKKSSLSFLSHDHGN